MQIVMYIDEFGEEHFYHEDHKDFDEATKGGYMSKYIFKVEGNKLRVFDENKVECPVH